MHLQRFGPVVVLFDALQKRVELGFGRQHRYGEGHPERKSGHITIDA